MMNILALRAWVKFHKPKSWVVVDDEEIDGIEGIFKLSWIQMASTATPAWLQQHWDATTPTPAWLIIF